MKFGIGDILSLPVTATKVALDVGGKAVSGITSPITGGAKATSANTALLGAQQTAAGKLQTLLDDPSSVTSMPGYAAGQEGVMRKVASQGGNLSGNQLTALQDYGTMFYDQQLSILNQLATGMGGTTSALNTSSGMSTGGIGGIMSLLTGQGGTGGSSGLLGQLGSLFGGSSGISSGANAFNSAALGGADEATLTAMLGGMGYAEGGAVTAGALEAGGSDAMLAMLALA